MILFRSLVFAAVFYLWSSLMALLILPTALIAPGAVLAWARLWNRGTALALRLICGIRVEVRGRQHIPAAGGLIAAKHHCMFDTFFPVNQLRRATFVTKQELRRIPLFSWYGVRSGAMLIIDRKGGAKALRKLMSEARGALAAGRQLVIYPEGARRRPGAQPNYKPGVAGLYADLDTSCTPLATNAGLHWPAHGFVRRPGKIVFEYLEPIPAGLERRAFLQLLQQRLEAACQALIVEDPSSSGS